MVFIVALLLTVITLLSGQSLNVSVLTGVFFATFTGIAMIYDKVTDIERKIDKLNRRNWYD